MEQPENNSLPYETAEQIILRWDATTSEDARVRMIFEGDRQEIDRYLQAVDQIQEQSKKINNAIQISLARLADEFRNILVSHASPIEMETLTQSMSSVHLNPRTSTRISYFPTDDDYSSRGDEDSISRDDSSSQSERGESSNISSIREIDLYPSDIVCDLRSIAKRMIAAGYFRLCVQMYSSVRKSAVDACFKKLGVEKLSIGDIQGMEWEDLNAKIGKWKRAATLCVRVLFASEKRLCEQIFEGLGTGGGDACFMETVRGPAVQLFNFAETIIISPWAPEKLLKILHLHEILFDLLPDIESVFDGKASESIRIQVTEILSRLAEPGRVMINEFEENVVLREPSRVTVPGGTIHPLTRYVMDYISFISDYKQTLENVIVSRPATGSQYSNDPSTPDMDFTDLEEQSPFALHLIWIIAILKFNLEENSKHYKDNSLAQIFIMNNLHYIVQKIKGSPELREIIGDNYLMKLTAKYRQARTRYLRATWVGVMYCLRDEGLHESGSFSSGVSKSVLRERFKSFNAMFEDVHKTQALWLVPDAQLREELGISISELLIPAYRSFLGRFRSHIESGRHPENYIKYSVKDLETAVLDFFEGSAV
ncbi:hypothetical protein LXL04_009028 [Taraxacum kok-saghyz]